MPTPTANTAPCGETVTNLEAVAHGTSGNPVINTGKVITVDPNTNFIGAAKQQNAVVYNTPHSTGVTQKPFLHQENRLEKELIFFMILITLTGFLLLFLRQKINN